MKSLRYMSVAELVQSERICDRRLLLRENDETTVPDGLTSIAVGGAKDGDESRERQKMENAARVAWLLTRSYIDFCLRSNISHDDTQHKLALIDLDNFFVNFGRDEDGSEKMKGTLENSPMIIQQDMHMPNEVTDMDGKPLGLGYFSLTNGDAKLGEQQDEIGRSPSVPESNGEAMGAHQNACIEKWGALFEVDILFPSPLKNDAEGCLSLHSKVTPMQVLGKLLYSIFCCGKLPPSDFFGTAAPTSTEMEMKESEGEKLFDQRYTKSFRSTQVTIFSRLVESKAFPISICRLLSGLIDTETDLQFVSFEQVIQELDQMISQPHLLLHDSNISRGILSPPILFGQVYYGREKEIGKIIKVASQIQHAPLELNVGVEAVFVSGVAGSGKSRLVQTASDRLSDLGWTLVKSKFERGAEHASRGIVLSMFDEVVSLLVRMKESERSPDELANSQRASKSILDSIGNDGLSQLVDFLPSLQLLFDDIDSNERKRVEDWQLSFYLSKILEALLESGQHIIVCCDDLQWADRTSLSLITEVLTKLGEDLRHACHRCLFIGLYREDEVDDDHPLSIQFSYLQTSSNINTTEVKLTGISKNDVANMLMTELKLPLRLVRDLADAVYKKTGGHAFFIVELLNSLLRDSIIDYSPTCHRYAWDQDAIDLIQTGDSVAELIASNISSLPDKSKEVLRVLSCFGVQTDIPLLEILEKFEEGIISNLDAFIEQGILDRAGPIIIFTHDLIQQSVYESMPLAQRQMLHLQIGEFLGELASTDVPPNPGIDPMTRCMSQLQFHGQTFYAGSSWTSSLVSIACDQLDAAGPDAISDDLQRMEFAEWNLSAGRNASHHSDFRAALYYYSKGIDFLGRECWLNDLKLCLALHEGAVFSSFALGEAKEVVQHAENVIQHVSFEHTLEVQSVLLKSLTQSGKHDECISRGISILRKLNFDIPLSPTKEVVVNAVASTYRIVSQYSIDQILNLCEKFIEDPRVQSIVKIVSAVFGSCYAVGSPFLPLISCESVEYSLKHGICQESNVAFAALGMFKIGFDADYLGGKKLGEMVRAITERCQKTNKSKMLDIDSSHMLLCTTIDIWFTSPLAISHTLLALSRVCLDSGQSELAMFAIRMSLRHRLLGGDNVPLVMQSAKETRLLIAHRSKHDAKLVALEYTLIIELTGKKNCKNVPSFDDLLPYAKTLGDNDPRLRVIRIYGAIIEFWRGNYHQAGAYSGAAWKMHSVSKMPQILFIYHTFFGGLIALRLYQQGNCDEAEYEKEGREMMERMGTWANNSMPVFENKWRLLQAEHSASVQKHDEAKTLYEASIKAAYDSGNIHEMALALELLGDYYASRGNASEAKDSYGKAYVAYNEWGATAVANRLLQKHSLDPSIANADLSKMKRERVE